MIKIINGKKYDTSTAEKVGEWDNGYSISDFHCCAETLYRKRTGEFFLYGRGHALSKYAGHSGNMSGWGESIIPLTEDKAKKWAEEKLSGEEYVEIFGDPEAADERSALNLSLSKSAISVLKRKALENNMSVSAYLEKLVEKL